MHGPGTLYIGSRPPRVIVYARLRRRLLDERARPCLALLYCTRPFLAKLPDVLVQTNTHTRPRIQGSREAQASPHTSLRQPRAPPLGLLQW